MRRLTLLIGLLALVACTPSTTTVPATDGTSSSSVSSVTAMAPSSDARVMAGKGIMIRVDQTVTEDAQSVPHNKAILHISGVVTQDVDLGDVQGELSYIDSTTYPVYAEQEQKPETAGEFTSWFAGQGEQINVTIQNQTLVISRLFGDEQGTCTGPDQIASIPLGGDVVVEWENLPTTTDKSSIAFCNKP